MKRPLKLKVVIPILLVAALLAIACTGITISNYIEVSENYTDSLAETIANTCSLVIDGDKVAEYRETRKRDTQYYEVWNKLIDYRNTNKDIVELQVVYFDEEGSHYIFDTDLSEKGAFLGDFSALNEEREKIKDRLVACEDIGSIQYQKSTELYIPIKSSYNIPVAYVVVGISNEENIASRNAYIAKLTLALLLIAALLTVVLISYMHRIVIRPINILTEAAANYGKRFELENYHSPLEAVRLKTGDELERLCDSMKKMEHDIRVSSENLVRATWESTHDSMTGCYNKRYYQKLLEQIAEYEIYGIIYLDVDNLKRMNDTYGHDKGDEVIINAASFVHKYEEENWRGCRIGGDEFVVFIRDCTREKLDSVIKEMKEDEQGQLAETNNDFVCRLAIGGALRMEGEAMEETIRRAEERMYQNKHSKR